MLHLWGAHADELHVYQYHTPGNSGEPTPRGEDGGPVPGCVMFGLNLAKLWIIVDTLESMTRQVACKVCTGTLQNGTGLWIELLAEEDSDPECLGSSTLDVLCS